MLKTISSLVIILLLSTCIATQTRQDARPQQQKKYLSQSRQLVLVVTGDWDAVSGRLRRFERPNRKSGWKPVGSDIEIVVGEKGLGWGVGLHDEAGDGPIKREGDGKAPAGIFKLSSAFGYAPPAEARRLKLPYLPLTPSIECVDDVNSRRYNLILDRGGVKDVDWKSSEHMRRSDELYRWGVVVGHNASPPVAGQGSCIFLHIWRGPRRGTAGCTAMVQANLEELLRWLDLAKKPILVQLPEAEFGRFRPVWGLPTTYLK